MAGRSKELGYSLLLAKSWEMHGFQDVVRIYDMAGYEVKMAGRAL